MSPRYFLLLALQTPRRTTRRSDKNAQTDPPPAPATPPRQSAAEYATNASNYHEDLLHDLFRVVRSADAAHAQTLVAMIQNHASLEEVRIYLDSALADTPAPAQGQQAWSNMDRLRRGIEVESEAPRFRPQIMDIRFLCGSAPFRIPAKPWTSVTDDDDLVSHLVSLYLVWDYPFYAFFDRQSCVKDMARGNIKSDFCSPFLVNALLANACSHLFERRGDTRLATLQATLLLYERYSLSGYDDWGYAMLHRAIEMAESIGIVNSPGLHLRPSQMSEDMIVSIKRTAWGLFQADTVVHTNFLRPSRVRNVSVSRINAVEAGSDDDWTPYPIESTPLSSHMGVYFDEACKLSFIARDVSWNLSRTESTSVDPSQRNQELYNRLSEWEKGLPETFAPEEQIAPHIVLLRMRYHTLVINLCCDRLGTPPTQTESNERAPAQDREFRAEDIAVSSARAIASLTQTIRTEWGMEHAHQFAMYAVNLALFTLLDQDGFNILDRDFLSLTSALSIVACRSQLGRSIFHLFKLSVRSRNQSNRVQQSEAVPSGIKELFQDSRSQAPDRWDHFAEGLTKIDGEMSHLDTFYESLQSSATDGLQDMLQRYEQLSVGTEDQWRRRVKGETAF
ncbi:pathway-specific regulatory protein [Aspergillus ellipticus CBS 707.79]|uniref:Pathway-specific regulatory protein n=1 Tax=Aspergillus ellipticus CBS 707.79 TaxID=1448320 RepID=A0A319DEE8_9EURO|nr:pathway-specific regulatory protein [Aspergillus ellipticus CBS 707.79]